MCGPVQLLTLHHIIIIVLLKYLCFYECECELKDTLNEFLSLGNMVKSHGQVTVSEEAEQMRFAQQPEKASVNYYYYYNRCSALTGASIKKF